MEGYTNGGVNRGYSFDNTFLMHMFMDGNISPNIGSDVETALCNFVELLKYDHNLSDSDVKNELDKSVKLMQIINKSMNLNIPDSAISKTPDLDIEEANDANEDSKKKSKKEPKKGSEKESKKNSKKKSEVDHVVDFSNAHKEIAKKINELIERKGTDNNYDSLKEVDKIYNAKKILFIVAKVFALANYIIKSLDNENDIFLPTMWFSESSNGSGHAIGVYISKKDNTYSIAIINSGEGVNRHPLHNIDRNTCYQNVCVIPVNNTTCLLKLVMMCIGGHFRDMLAKVFKTIGNTINEIDDVDEIVNDIDNVYRECIKHANYYYVKLLSGNVFYDSILEVLKIDDFDNCRDAKYCFGLQISGSCTFNSIYYFLRYMYMSKGQSEHNDFIKVFENIKAVIKTEILRKYATKSFSMKDEDMNIANVLCVNERNSNITYADVCNNYKNSVIYDMSNKLHSHENVDNYEGIYNYGKKDMSFEKLIKFDKMFEKIYLSLDVNGANINDCVWDMCILIQSMTHNYCVLETDDDFSLVDFEATKLRAEFIRKMFINKFVKCVMDVNERTVNNDRFYNIFNNNNLDKKSTLCEFLANCNVIVCTLRSRSVHRKEHILPLFLFGNLVARVLIKNEVMKLTNMKPSESEFPISFETDIAPSIMIEKNKHLSDIYKFHEYYVLDNSTEGQPDVYYLNAYHDKWKLVNNDFLCYLYNILNIVGIKKNVLFTTLGYSEYTSRHTLGGNITNTTQITLDGVDKHDICIVSYIGSIVIENKKYGTKIGYDSKEFYDSVILFDGVYDIHHGESVTFFESCSHFFNNVVYKRESNDNVYFYNEYVLNKLVNSNNKGNKSKNVTLDKNAALNKIDCHNYEYNDDGTIRSTSLYNMPKRHKQKYNVSLYGSTKDTKDVIDTADMDNVKNSKIIVDNFVEKYENLNIVLRNFKQNSTLHITPNMNHNAAISVGSTNIISNNPGVHTTDYNFYFDIKKMNFFSSNISKIEKLLEILDIEVFIKFIVENLIAKYIFDIVMHNDELLLLINKHLDNHIDFINKNDCYNGKSKKNEKRRFVGILKVLKIFVMDKNDSNNNDDVSVNSDFTETMLYYMRMSDVLDYRYSTEKLFRSDLLVSLYFSKKRGCMIDKVMHNYAFTTRDILLKRYKNCIVKHNNEDDTFTVHKNDNTEQLISVCVNNNNIRLPKSIRDKYIYILDPATNYLDILLVPENDFAYAKHNTLVTNAFVNDDDQNNNKQNNNNQNNNKQNNNNQNSNKQNNNKQNNNKQNNNNQNNNNKNNNNQNNNGESKKKNKQNTSDAIQNSKQKKDSKKSNQKGGVRHGNDNYDDHDGNDDDYDEYNFEYVCENVSKYIDDSDRYADMNDNNDYDEYIKNKQHDDYYNDYDRQEQWPPRSNNNEDDDGWPPRSNNNNYGYNDDGWPPNNNYGNNDHNNHNNNNNNNNNNIINNVVNVNDNHLIKVYKHYDNKTFIYVRSLNELPECENAKLLIKTLNKVTSHILLWHNQQHNICIIDLPYVLNNDNVPLSFIIDSDGNINHDGYVVGVSSFLLNRYSNDTHNIFILEKNNDHKILVINENIEHVKESLKNMLSSNYIFGEKIKKNENELNDIVKSIINEDMISNKYYVIDIHQTGLYLSFPSEGAYYSYFMYANIHQKTDIINMLYSYSPAYLENESIKNLLYYPNTPYNCYIHHKYKVLCDGSTIIDQFYKNVPTVELINRRTMYYLEKYRLKKNNNNNNKTKKSEQKPKPDEKLMFNFMAHIQKNKNVITYDKVNIDSYVNGISDNIFKKDVVAAITYFISNEKFIKCKLSPSVCGTANKILDIIGINEENVLGTIGQYYETISEYVSSIDFIHTCDYIDAIKNNSKLFYDLLALKKSQYLIEKIKEIKCDSNENYCNEVLLLANMLDSHYVHMGERDNDTMIFEIMFGSLIREQQYKMFNEIVDNLNGVKINNNKNYNIYQMLMGKGKTKVITPMLLFRFVLSNKVMKNAVIVLPNHLISQTYDMIVKNYAHVMDNTSIKKMYVKRHDDENYVRSFFENSVIGTGDNIVKKNIIVTNISSLQSIILRKCEQSHGAYPFNVDDTLFIFDEIDSLSDPLANELNHPTGKKEKDIYDNLSIDVVVHVTLSLFNNKLLNLFEINIEKGKQCVNDSISEYKTTKYKNINNKYDENMVAYLFDKIEKTFAVILQNVHNKNYGFDTKAEKSFIAIPYNGVNSPISGSEFSDLYVKIAFTCMSYMYEKSLRQCDIVNIKSYIKNKYKECSNELSLFMSDDLIVATKINIDDVQNIDNMDKNFIKKNDSLIEHYLKNVVFAEYLDQYRKQYNCSFIDVVGDSFSKYKIGFSGTVSDIHIEELKISNKEPEYIFNNIVSDDAAMGSIYSAFLGVTQNNIIPSVHEGIDCENFEDIINFIKDNEYDALIDTGAYLRKHTSKLIISEIKKNIPIYKTYVYIDESGKEQRLHNKDSYTKEMFIYYDQLHTIGHDVSDQPYKMKGLVTIDHFNRLTEISQGMFRLRKLNYGHVVDFMVKNLDNGVKSCQSLLLHLKKKDDEHNENTLSFASLQQLKYLSRANKEEYIIEKDPVTGENVKKCNRYAEDVYYDIEHLNDSANGYEKFIKNNFGIATKDENIKKLQDKALKATDNHNKIQEQEQISVNIVKDVKLVVDFTQKINVTDRFGKLNNEQEKNRYVRDYLNGSELRERFYIYKNDTDKNNKHKIKNNNNNYDAVHNLLHMNSIFLSPSIFNRNYDILGDHKNVIENDSIDAYNYYAMQIFDEKMKSYILIVKGSEYIPIDIYLRENNNSHKVVVYNKYDDIVYTNLSNDDIKNNSARDKKLSLAKYIIGGKNIIDLLLAGKVLLDACNRMNIGSYEKNENIRNLKNMLDEYMLITAKNTSLIKMIDNCIGKYDIYDNTDDNKDGNKMSPFDNYINSIAEGNTRLKEILGINNASDEVINNLVKKYNHIVNQQGGTTHNYQYNVEKYKLYKRAFEAIRK